MNKKLFSFIAILLIVVIAYSFKNHLFIFSNNQDEVAFTLVVPSERFPETAAHIKVAEEHGESNICTIDRKGADENRKKSLKGIPTKKGFDRDEFPRAMCADGGQGADIEYVTPADNRGAGSCIANQLEKVEDGTKVKIVVK